MPTIAFYAPLKPPTHPTPSGDREIARSVLEALNTIGQNYDAKLVSDFRTYDGKGNHGIQLTLIAQAKVEARKLIALGQEQNWRLWFTYHNYYKSPDLIGPIVTKALDIPYILLEATRAKKRLNGPWSHYAQLAEFACDKADTILYFTQHDRQSLLDYKPKGQKIIHLPPFLAQGISTAPKRTKPKSNTLLSVGMLRKGAKTQSYKLIAKTLTALKTTDWTLKIAGDGPARPEIEKLFAPFKSRVTFLGQCTSAELAEQYQSASVFLWPGVDEAFGMVYLEAQAAGLPVIAQNLPGVCDVINPKTMLIPPNMPDKMAHAVDTMLTSTDLWQRNSHAGTEFIKQNHLFVAASKNLSTILSPFIGSRP